MSIKGNAVESKVIEMAAERGVGLYGSHKDLLWRIKKDLNDGKISMEDVIRMLKDNKDFRLNFSGDDFDKIKNL
jgi:hypothetical protein